MLTVRKRVTIADGVDVDLLFTPRLYSYTGYAGVTFETPDNPTTPDFIGIYADIFFCAALNAWELDGHGSEDDFPRTRGDFHAWAQADPKSFQDTIDFGLRALTGKGLREYADTAPSEGGDVKKKTSRFRGMTSKPS